MLTTAPLRAEEIPEICGAFAALGWNKPADLYQHYLQECAAGRRIVVVARWEQLFAGYATLLWELTYAPFQRAKVPEISDLNVLPLLRRRGIATRLMRELEDLGRTRSVVVGIGVGLTEDYGAAQQLYVRRGYVPDGHGAQANGVALTRGDVVTIDDDTILYLCRRFDR